MTLTAISRRRSKLILLIILSFSPPSSSLMCGMRCKEVFDVKSRDICKETSKYCQFYKELDGIDCNTYCRNHGGSCIKAFKDSGSDCEYSEKAPCDETMGDGICRCSWPECIDPDGNDGDTEDTADTSDNTCNMSCKKVFDVPSKDICKEKSKFCQFFKVLDGSNCEKYCKKHGGRCIRAFNDGGNHCDYTDRAPCDDDMNEGICRCSWPECIDPDGDDGDTPDRSDKDDNYITLRIKANIDGSSKLRIQNNEISWKHYGWSAPGLHRCYWSDPQGCTGDPDDGCFMEGDPRTCHKPTVINGVDWWPIWPYEGGSEGRSSCGGCKTDTFDLRDIGIDLGPAPVLIKSTIASDDKDRNCNSDCSQLQYGNGDKLWGSKCCDVVSKEEKIEVGIFDHWGGQTLSEEAADYKIILKIKSSRDYDGGNCYDREKDCCSCIKECVRNESGRSKEKKCVSDDCRGACKDAADECGGWKRSEWKKFFNKKCTYGFEW
mmetsp:Transcript_19864/g.44268  ORF Transcript_19864/g.44268 Transcript_19864/m.44268 type:complete len:490 (+) Transcript_19864:91-1560(+)